MTDVPNADPTQVKPHPLAPRGVRWAALLFFIFMLLMLEGQAFRAIWAQGPDFEYFYQAGRSLLDQGDFDQGRVTPTGPIDERGTLDWYLPFVARFMTIWVALGDLLVEPMDAFVQVAIRPIAEWAAERQGHPLNEDLITVTPQRASGMIWLAMNLVIFVVIVRLMAVRVMSLPTKDWLVVQFVPLLVTIGAWHWEFWLNQIDTLALLFIVLSYVQWEKSRHYSAGIWIAFAALLKLTPGLVIVWFALKRQWRVVITAAVVMLLAAPVGDVITFGPQKAWDANFGWLKRAILEGSHRALIKSQREMDWRNQASGAVFSRLLHPTSYTWKIDNDARLAKLLNEEPGYVNLTHMPLSTIAFMQMGFTVLMLGGLLWLARKPAAKLGVWPLRAEWALFVLAMLWFMPVMRRYHIIMAFPAVCVLAAAVHYAGQQKVWSRFTNLTLIAVLGIQFAAAQTVMVEAHGGILFALLWLGVPLILLRFWLGRDEQALSRCYTQELVRGRIQKNQ